MTQRNSTVEGKNRSTQTVPKKERMAGQQTKILKDFKHAQSEQSMRDSWNTTK